MSLRAELHDAIDEVSPPAPHLELRVTQLLIDHEGDKKVVRPPAGRARWTKGVRGVLTLVAAALVVALIGGLVLEGRLLRELNPPTPAVNQSELKKLETRTLQFPVVKTGDPCPISPLTDTSANGPEGLVFGTGPVYLTPLGHGKTTTNRGTWMVLSLQVDTTKASGLILIRASDLQTGTQVVFTRFPLNAVGAPGDGIPTGKVIGSQVIYGETVQLHPELVIDTSRVDVGTRWGDWPIYKSYMGFPKTATGCVGFQVDGVMTGGATFTELIVVSGS
jgi:hypothetical protein